MKEPSDCLTRFQVYVSTRKVPVEVLTVPDGPSVVRLVNHYGALEKYKVRKGKVTFLNDGLKFWTISYYNLLFIHL